MVGVRWCLGCHGVGGELGVQFGWVTIFIFSFLLVVIY